MGVSEIQRLKQLEDENAKLKRVVADLTLDKAMLQDALRKKSRPPSDARSCVTCSTRTNRRLAFYVDWLCLTFAGSTQRPDVDFLFMKIKQRDRALR